MKPLSKILTITSIAVLAIILTSCNEKQREIKEINTSKILMLDTINSKVTWQRYLEQGKTTTKVKIFGQLADVTIDGLKLNTDGRVLLKSGEMVNVNDSLTNCEVQFDLNMVSVQKQNTKKDKLLKTRQLKNSKFSITVTKEKPSVYLMVNKMTINDVTKEPITKASTDFENDSLIVIKGEVIFNTLDWPIRDDDNIKSVIKDEITIDMELLFNLVNVKKDTVYVQN